MSISITLAVNTGGIEEVVVYSENSPTWSTLWSEVDINFDILEGKTARELAPILRKATSQMSAQARYLLGLCKDQDPDQYRAALRFLRKLADACEDHPLSVLGVHR